jgi:ribosomal protein S18 acetylase RimI-like enzyme
MPDLEVRPARPEDRDAVLAFCQQTWDWGDYIEHVWDEWLSSPQCTLFVATLDGQPVGITNVRMLNDTEAWFEGMRVDPVFRQHGIGTALSHAQFAEATRRGATTIRLITEATNSASIHLLEKSDFTHVGAYVIYRATADTQPQKRSYALETPVLATLADLNDIIDYLNTSNIFPAIGGLYYQGFTAFTITRELIFEKIHAQQLYILRRWDRLDGLAIAEPRSWPFDKHLFVGYIDGTTESISMIAYALRHLLPDLNLEKIIAHVPDLMMVRDAFVGAGYETDGKVFYTYENILV